MLMQVEPDVTVPEIDEALQHMHDLLFASAPQFRDVITGCIDDLLDARLEITGGYDAGNAGAGFGVGEGLH